MTGEIRAMRAGDFDHLLGNRVTVYRLPATTNADLGGAPSQTRVPVSALSNLKASVQPADSSTVYRYSERELRVSHTIMLSGRVALQDGDVLQDEGGRKFELKGAGDDCGLGVLTYADCLLIAGAGLGAT